ncbi:hypothetical protein Hanom_Chr00s006654g01735181 [Helianthus anomalus]
MVLESRTVQNINLTNILAGKTVKPLSRKLYKTSSKLSSNLLGLVKDDTLIFHLKPLHSILLGDPVLNTDTSLAPAATPHTVTRAF